MPKSTHKKKQKICESWRRSRRQQKDLPTECDSECEMNINCSMIYARHSINWNRFILIIFLSKVIDIITATFYWKFITPSRSTQGA